MSDQLPLVYNIKTVDANVCQFVNTLMMPPVRVVGITGIDEVFGHAVDYLSMCDTTISNVPGNYDAPPIPLVTRDFDPSVRYAYHPARCDRRCLITPTHDPYDVSMDAKRSEAIRTLAEKYRMPNVEIMRAAMQILEEAALAQKGHYLFRLLRKRGGALIVHVRRNLRAANVHILEPHAFQ
jgi:hypothetical protein